MRAHENPFRSERLEALEFLPQNDAWPAIMARLAALNHRGAIIGPKGSGKTTMLGELKMRLAEAGWRVQSIRITAEARGLPAINPDPQTIVLLDGAEQLNRLRWKWFQWKLRRAGGLVISTHRAGRMNTIHRTETSPDLLAELMERLGAKGTEAGERFRACGGNLREAFFRLYVETSG